MELSIGKKRANKDYFNNNPLMLAVSATFTAEPIDNYIRFWCEKFNLPAVIKFASYNQVFQELLDTSSLISKNSGLNVLLIRFEDWIREDKSDDEVKIEKLERNYQELLKILRIKKKIIPYFIGIFPVSTHLTLSCTIVNYLEKMNIRWKQDLRNIEDIHIVDFYEAFKLYDLEGIFDSTKDKAGHIPFTDEFISVIGTMIARKICAWRKQVFKVIVLDCDNTLWQGICGENTAGDIVITEPYMELQRFMLQKYNEGMLLTLCSKNNEKDVWKVFENNKQMLLRREHFAAYRINWKAKSQNIRELADELNLGADSFVFLDDSPSECAEVIKNCPEVLTLQLPENQNQIKMFLRHVWAFDKFKITKEDKIRNQMYTADKKRRISQEETNSLDDFLKGLDIQMSMSLMEKQHIDRVAQLTQRTNQFNLSTIRRTANDINDIFRLQHLKCRIIDVADRFGEYGIVGVVITEEKGKTLFIETLLLSCRVLGKQIEDSILAGLARYCREHGIYVMEAKYLPTEKNEQVLEFLKRTGWKRMESTEHYTRFTISVDDIPMYPQNVSCSFDSSHSERKIIKYEDNTNHELSYQDSGSSIKAYKDIFPDISKWMFNMMGWENLLHVEYIYPLKYCSVEELVRVQLHNSYRTWDLKMENSKNPTIQQKLMRILADNNQSDRLPEELDLDLKLTEIGLNSINFIKLIVNIEKIFKFRFHNEDLEFYKFPTLRSLVSYVEGRTSSETCCY
jgi:iturin family lipopeptide synthetase A